MNDDDEYIKEMERFVLLHEQRAVELEDEVGRLRETVEVQTNAADAAAEAVGAMAVKLSAVLAENARLRALALVLYRSLSDEPIDSLAWLSPDQRRELADIVAALNPHLDTSATGEGDE